MNLAVCVPKDVSCELLLYKKGESEPDQVIEMPAEEGIGEVRFLALEDLVRFRPFYTRAVRRYVFWNTY